jgi:ABC-type antimicrobial peptide transport system permease subunit
MLVLCGVTTGLFASAILSRLLSAFLYSVSPLDPSAFTAVSIIMMVTAFLGNYLPARKASTIAPTEALRNQ